MSSATSSRSAAERATRATRQPAAASALAVAAPMPREAPVINAVRLRTSKPKNLKRTQVASFYSQTYLRQDEAGFLRKTRFLSYFQAKKECHEETTQLPHVLCVRPRESHWAQDGFL
jgi:hypothetical protein